MIYDRTAFFTYVRRAPFGGKLSASQIDGLERILKYAEARSTPLEFLGYMLATAFHETAATMQPIAEFGGKTKKYAPYYGRGLVQLTWETNYKKYGIAGTPEKALEWPTALSVMFNGMEKGEFTGKPLKAYFAGPKDDPVGARRIINGTDKASLIAGYYASFTGALEAAHPSTPIPTDVTPEARKPDDVKPLESAWFKTILAALCGSGGFSAISGVNNPWAFGVIALLVIVGGVGVWAVSTGRISINRIADQAASLGVTRTDGPGMANPDVVQSESGGESGSTPESKPGEPSP